MKSIKFYILLALPVIIFLFPVSAYAHSGIGGGAGFFNGFNHPLSGIDHILAMVAVGIWASQTGGKAVRAVPATFVGIMLIGYILGISGVSIPFVEAGILTSVLILGLLIATAVRLPLAAGMTIVGLFALFHGHSHGTEMPFALSGLAYGAGFAVSTALLHLSGIVTGGLLQKKADARLIRYSGAAIAVAGIFLFFV